MSKFSISNDKCSVLIDHLTLIEINPLMINVPHHIETCQLISNGNQLTGFYMMGDIGH